MPGLPELKAPAGSSSEDIVNPQTPNPQGAQTPTPKGRGSRSDETSTPKPRIPKQLSPKESAVKEAQKISNSAQKKVIEYRGIIPELRKETHQWPQEIATSLETKLSIVTKALFDLQKVMVDSPEIDVQTILDKTSECSTLVDSMTDDYLRGKGTLPKAKAKGKAKAKSKS